MKLSTKSMASLLTAVKRTVDGSRSVGGAGYKKLERILGRHDRKGDLRASVLGIDTATYRSERRKYSLEELVRKHGFNDIIVFLQALSAKLRHELRCRGWSVAKLQRFEMSAV